MHYFSKILLAYSCSIGLVCATPVATPDTKAVQRLISSYVVPYMKNHTVPGVGIAVYYNGQDYFFNYGVANLSTQAPVTQNTLFEIASVTKVFTATMLSYEIGQGKIQLDDDIVDYLPPLVDTVDLSIDDVTPQDLATHTSSLSRDIEDFGVKRGTVLANASGISYIDLLQQSILDPLNMTNTYIYVPKSEYPQRAHGYTTNNKPAPFFVPTTILGGGELVSTASDLLLFLKANLNILPNGISPNFSNAIKLTQQPYFQVAPAFSMGLGWELHTHPAGIFYTKDGENKGFTTFVGFVPSNQIAIVVLMNKNHQDVVKLGDDLLERLVSLNKNGKAT